MPTTEADLKDARAQLDLVRSFFPRVDGRLSTILALDTGMLAALGASVPSLQSLPLWSITAPIITMTLLAVSYAYLYRAGFPDVRGGQGSVTYFREIARRRESQFIEDYTAHTLDSLRKDVLGQVWRNSEILVEKYRCMKVSFICMALGAVPWIISLAVFAIERAKVHVLIGAK